MAEAAVAAENPVLQRFYCHMCRIKFESCSATYTCPHCSDGFVEQVEAQPDAESSYSLDYISDSDEEMFDVLFGPTDRIRYGTDPSRRGRQDGQNQTDGMRQPQTYENLIHEIIVNLGVGVGVNMRSGNGNMQLIFNPGDYAWGREGLDAIVTQLLNQIDTTGPPPLAKEVIDAIPTVDVTQEQVDTKLKCSVCWEEFQLNEKVRQLACQHVYHEPCIRPWLELHSTCPICRQDLGSDDQSSNTAPDNSGGRTFNALQQLFQAVQGSGAMGNSSDSTSTSTTTSTSSSSSGGSENS